MQHLQAHRCICSLPYTLWHRHCAVDVCVLYQLIPLPVVPGPERCSCVLCLSDLNATRHQADPMSAAHLFEQPLPPNAVLKHSKVSLVIRPKKALYVAGDCVEGILELSCTSDKVWLGRIAVEFRGDERERGTELGVMERRMAFQPKQCVLVTAHADRLCVVFLHPLQSCNRWTMLPSAPLSRPMSPSSPLPCHLPMQSCRLHHPHRGTGPLAKVSLASRSHSLSRQTLPARASLAATHHARTPSLARLQYSTRANDRRWSKGSRYR